MSKKTENELREEIQDEYSLEKEDERIDKILEIKKDRYTATQAKKKAQQEAVDYKKGKDYYKGKADPKKGQKIESKDTKGKEPNYSIKDIRALSDVHDDDVDVVVNWAKSNKISVAEAKKDKDLNVILKSHKEERESASASNTGGGKRGSSKVSGATLLSKAKEKNELPESDEDMDKLLDERYKPKA